MRSSPAQELFALTSPVIAAPTWMEVDKGTPSLVRLADGHYTRQQPGTSQFTRPGYNLCLLLSDGSAGWVTWRPDPFVGRMDNWQCWECTFFRNTGARMSSELIQEATALTFRRWGWPPRDGLRSAIGIEATRRRRSKHAPPGQCFVKAGWSPMFEKDGKAWLLAPYPEKKPKPPTKDRVREYVEPAGFRRCMEYRGIPFARIGMRVLVDGKPGAIVGHNDSANLDVLFDGDRHASNCHPGWMVVYLDDGGNPIAPPPAPGSDHG